MKSTFSLSLVTLATICALHSPLASAGDDAAKKLLKDAQTAFEKRADQSQNNEAISLLAKAEAEAQDSELKYEILVLASRAIYWKGMNVAGPIENNPAKLPVFEAGMAKAAAAKALNGDYADAYYYYGINLSRWGLAKGKMSALFKLGELKTNIQSAIDRETREGEAGESIDGYGPDRVFGRMYFELPGIAGGDNNKSLKYLETAYNKAGKPGSSHYLVALNTVYLAETLNEFKDSDRARAKQILTELLGQNAKTFNPARVPETEQEFAEARNLLAKIR